MGGNISAPKEDVIFRSGTSDGLGAGWDVMQVLYRREDGGQMRLANSFVIARHFDGAILRGFDYNKWERITDADDLQGYHDLFDKRDRSAAERLAITP
jgi:hypothetical protein